MKLDRIAIRPENTLESVLSLPCAIAALRAANPGSEIGVVVEDCFREAAHLLPNVDFISSNVDAAHYKIFDLKNETTSHAESAEWKAYSLGCSKFAQTNPYHQVDLWKKVVRQDGLEASFELLPADVDEKALPDLLLDNTRVRIMICANSLGIDELQSLIEGLSRAAVPARVFLIGPVPARRKSSMLLSVWQDTLDIVDLCGRLTVSQTAEAFRQADIAITAPGASALLSSGYGTFTVCVDSTGNPYQYPYGHGHLIVQPAGSDQLQPFSALATEIVQFAVTGNGGTLPSLEQWQEFADSQVDNFLGRLRLLATQRVEVVVDDAGGFTELHTRPLIYLGADLGDTSRAFYRLLWEHHLQGRTLVTHALDILQEDTVAQLCEELKAMQQLYELANFGRVYCGHVKKALAANDVEKAKEESARVQEVEDLLHQLAEAQAFLAPLCSFHSRHQALLPDLSASEMAQKMEELFLAIQSRVTVLLDLARTLFHTTYQSEAAAAGSANEGESFHG
jgi:ADP-heptose:LPS heptosyltransferase